MENQQSRVNMFKKFIWKVENFAQLTTVDMLYSAPFFLDGYPWRILVYPYGDNVDCISLYLDSAQSHSIDHEGMRDVTFRLTIYNHFNRYMSVTKESYHIFTEREKDQGFPYFMPLVVLHNPRLGFLVNDDCIIGVEVYVHSSGQANPMNQTANLAYSLTPGGPSSIHIEVPRAIPEIQVPDLDSLSEFPPLVHIEPIEHNDVELFSSSSCELVNFRGLGQVEKAFVPLLEEVCFRHPSLIECQQNKSHKFTEWAFTALGRVLYFLKTRKGKDMDDQACKDLQTLWEELETFRFDLSWLEPHIQSAFGMKSHVEKALQIEKLKKNVASLAFEIENLKTKLVAAEDDLDKARDLLTEEGLREEDLITELGYGLP